MANGISRWAEARHCRISLEHDGQRTVILSVNGKMETLRSIEALCGSHRIQRVPSTEKKGRRHSSSVTVVIVDSFHNDVFRLPWEEVDFEPTRGSGPGGQHKNKNYTAIRAVHRPTGLTVVMDGRSQNQNIQRAHTELERRLSRATEAAGREELNSVRVDQIQEDRAFNWCGWRDEAINHRTGQRTSMAKALKGKLDPLLD